MTELTEEEIDSIMHELAEYIRVEPFSFPFKIGKFMARTKKALRLLDGVEKRRKELESELDAITEKIENSQAEGRLDLIKQQNVIFEILQELQNLLEQSEKK